MANYSAKLTADTRQHDAALKKSAGEIYRYKAQTEATQKTIGGLAKGLTGKLLPAVGGVALAMKGLKETIRSTEQGADALDRQQAVLTSTVRHFFQSLNNGSFDGFLNGLGKIIDNAKEAYNAIDALGSFTTGRTPAMAKIESQISAVKLQIKRIKDGNGTGDIEALQKKLIQLQQERAAINRQGLGYAENAYKAAYRDITGREWNRTAEIAYNSGDPYNWAAKIFNNFNPFHKGTQDYIIRNNSLKDNELYQTAKAIMQNEYKLVEKFQPLLANYYNEITSLNNAELGEQRYAKPQPTKTPSTKTQPTDIKEEADKYVERIINDNIPVLFKDIIPQLFESEQYTEWFTDGISEAIDAFVAKEEEYTEAQRRIKGEVYGVADSLLGVLSAVESFGIFEDSAFSKFIDDLQHVIGLLKAIEALVTAIKAISSTINVLSGGGLSVGGILGAITGFSSGGIVGGSAYTGDRNIVRVNSGEMILNRREQARMFAMLNGSATTTQGGGNVKFTISGGDLVGVLNNYNKKNVRVL